MSVEVTAADIRTDADGTRYVRKRMGSNPVTGERVRHQVRIPDGMGDDEAVEYARERLSRFEPAVAVGAGQTLSELVEGCVRWYLDEGRIADTTAVAYRSAARHLGRLAGRPADEVTAGDVQMLYHELITGSEETGPALNPVTVRRLHVVLCRAYRWAVKNGDLKASPMVTVDRPKAEEYAGHAIKAADLARLERYLRGWRKLPAGTYAQRLRREAAFASWLALHTGMRRGEVCALRREDVDLRDGSLTVAGTMVEAGGLHRRDTTKGKRHRTIAITKRVRRHIRRHERVLRDDRGGRPRPMSAPLVSVRGTRPMWPQALSREFRAICDELGLEGSYTFHSLRHTHATELIDAGVDAKTVQQRLGHSDVRVTLSVYRDVAPATDGAAARAFDKRMRTTGGWQ